MERFVTYLEDIEGRIDPNPYHPLRMDAIRKLKSSKYDLVPLSQVVRFRRQLTESSAQDECYIGLENVESGTGILVQSSEKKESFGSAFRFAKGDILFPRLRPYLNKVYLAELSGVCSTEFHVLQAIQCKPEYLFAYLNSKLVVNQTSCLMTGNTLPRLQTDDIEKILVPIPPPEIQNQVSDVVQSAYQLKRKKEAEAQELLDSIDEYVLGELRIHVEPTPRTTFVIYYEDLTGRLDPYFYYPETDVIKKKVVQQHGEHRFAEVIDDIYRYPTFYGFEYQHSGIPVIKGENISEFGRIEQDQYFDCISDEIHNRFSRTKLKNGDLLFTVRGIIGKVGLFNGFVPEANINANLIRISIKKELADPLFLSVFLNSSIGQALIQNLASGQVQKTITVQDIRNIPIPLPPLKVQRRISTEIESRMNQADDLRTQANVEFGRAKAETERLILGT